MKGIDALIYLLRSISVNIHSGKAPRVRLSYHTGKRIKWGGFLVEKCWKGLKLRRYFRIETFGSTYNLFFFSKLHLPIFEKVTIIYFNKHIINMLALSLKLLSYDLTLYLIWITLITNRKLSKGK